MSTGRRSDYDNIYRERRVPAAQAVSGIDGDVDVAMGMALGEPPALLRALASHIRGNDLRDVRLWYFHSMPTAAETVLTYEMMDRVRPHCMFMGPTERALEARGAADGRRVVNFVPVAFSDAPRLLSQHVELDTFITTVSPMDRHGYFTFGANNDYASTVARAAKRVIVEVNSNLPRVFGDSTLHVSEIDAIVENDEPLFEMPLREPTQQEDTISDIIANMVPDRACLQMGIGALPNAVCAKLKDRMDLGIHTELLSPGLADLVECGAVSNRYKATFPGRSVFTFALGTERLYRMLDDNPGFNSHPVNIVNDPRHIAKNPGVVSVNATLQVDLFGACNSENLQGRQFSGSGGQLDFVRGARASRGGRSIIACPSTASNGKVSRIVPILTGAVTTPRNDVDTIVTEYGAAHLIGLSGRERAESLIGLAHPDFREDLRAQARHLNML